MRDARGRRNEKVVETRALSPRGGRQSDTMLAFRNSSSTCGVSSIKIGRARRTTMTAAAIVCTMMFSVVLVALPLFAVGADTGDIFSDWSAEDWAHLQTTDPTLWLKSAQSYYQIYGRLPGGGSDGSANDATNVNEDEYDDNDNEDEYYDGNDDQNHYGYEDENENDVSIKEEFVSMIMGEGVKTPSNNEEEEEEQQNNATSIPNNLNLPFGSQFHGGDGTEWFLPYGDGDEDEEETPPIQPPTQPEITVPEAEIENQAYYATTTGSTTTSSSETTTTTVEPGRNRPSGGGSTADHLSEWFQFDQDTYSDTKGHNGQGGLNPGHYLHVKPSSAADDEKMDDYYYGYDTEDADSTSSTTTTGGGGFDWTDRQVLEYLYQQTDGSSSWRRKDHWLEATKSICSWYGIQCKAGREEVTAIHLSSNGLKGLVPVAHLLSMKHLQEISLDGNNIDLDSSTGGLTEDTLRTPSPLRSLDVRDSGMSRLNGIFITPDGGNLRVPNLRTLRASRNNLSGPFPDQVLQMTSLETLELDFNDITGTIPPEISNLSNLEYLSMESNNLEGSIPEDIGNLKLLRSLMLQDNKFTGTVPEDALNAFTELETLDLSNQREDDEYGEGGGLSGSLPSLTSQTKLSYIDLSFNKFTGPVPSGFLQGLTSTSEWFTLELHDNYLTGTIPQTFGKFDPSSVQLSNNFFNDMEAGLCDQFSTKDCSLLVCGPNMFSKSEGRSIPNEPCIPCPSGTVTPYLGSTECYDSQSVPSPNNAGATSTTAGGEGIVNSDAERDALKELYDNCGGDSWSRRINWLREDISTDTPSHCQWQGITCDENGFVNVIRLSSNGLKGTPPASLFTNLPKLSALFLNGNQIQFDFKSLGGSATSNLETLDLTSTGLFSLEGLESVTTNLKSLALASNSLTGDAPLNKLWTQTSLEELVLDYNTFNTDFPEGITKLTNLQLFSCAGCHFSGSLPLDMTGSLKKLTHLRLEDNLLSFNLNDSAIPHMTQLDTIDLSNQESSEQIFGPLPSFSNFKSLRRLDLSWNSLTGTIPQGFLSKVQPSSLEVVDIRANILEGALPNLVNIIHKVDVADNKLSSIDPANCENDEIRNYGCDGIMCAPGSWNKEGRQTSVFGQCESCPRASYFGAMECDDTTYTADDNTEDNQMGEGTTITSDEGDNGGDENDDDGEMNDDDIIEEEFDGATSSLKSDRDILQSFFMSMEGLKWKSSTNWLDSDTSICTWYGIKCADQTKETVEAIELKSNNLQGRVPGIIFELKELTTLLLDGNPITVDFTLMGNAPKLKVLDLSNTQVWSLHGLDGSTSELTDLHLSNTKLEGTVPSEIFTLKQLERLTLDYNALGGSFPLEIDQLSRLTYLSAHENQFTGSLPASLGGLSDLMFLTLQNNAFTGTIPDAFKALSSLWFLDLSNQDGDGFTGPVPSFDTFTQLKRLDLSHNSFAGNIPSDFLMGVDMNLFEYVDLSYNQLDGTVPAALSKLSPDTYYLQENKFSGIDPSVCSKASDGQNCNEILCPIGTYSASDDTGREEAGADAESCAACASSQYFGATSCDDVPEDSTTPQQEKKEEEEAAAAATAEAIASGDPQKDRAILTEFYNACGGPRWTQSSNWLSSTSVCEWHGIRCSDEPDATEHVSAIMLSSNNLVGTPPSSLFDLILLDTLILDSNEILFKFDGIEKAERLETLDISATGLSSLGGIEKAVTITNLHASSNNLQGPFPDQLLALMKLERLTLDFNALTGTLPTTINDLSHMKLLSMADNLFTGQLPEFNAFTLAELQTLRLQRNLFTGTLPPSLNDLQGMTTIDLSDQGYEDSAESMSSPKGIGGPLLDFASWKDVRRIDLSSNAITGSIPETFLHGASSEFFEFADLTHNLLEGEIPSGVAPIVERVYFQDNQITSVSSDLCDTSLGGNIAEFQCDAILCPVQSYNERGRQDSPYFPCTECLGNLYMGSTTCPCLEDPTGDGCGSSNHQNYNVTEDYYVDETMENDDGEDTTNTATETSVGATAPSTTTSTVSSSNDRAILTKFYNQCGGYYWWKNDNWLKDDVSICEWYGIKCVDNKKTEIVQAIRLGANNVKHTPPQELFQLSQLGSISLYSNPELTFSFQGIGNAKGLTHLALDATGLKSLNGIEKAPNLVELEARFNSLSGPIPPGIAQLKTLRRLSLSHNELEAPFPSFDEMPFLEDILLGSNKIQANLGSLQVPSTLRMLDLSDNVLTGIIPPDFLSNVPETSDLIIDLSNNQLTGNVPSSALGRFDEMTIKLRDNKLNSIDKDLCDKSEWNGGDVGRYKCDGILCPEGRSSSNGRQNSDEEGCIPCRGSDFLGGTLCSSSDKRHHSTMSSSASRTTLPSTIWIVTMITSCVVAAIYMITEQF